MADATNTTSPSAQPSPTINPARRTEEVRQLARKLADLELELSKLGKTRDTMLFTRFLVERALHYGYAARGEDCNFEAIYSEGFHILSYLSDQACSEVIDVQQAFRSAAQGDGVVGAAMDTIHKASPLGETWTNESYPAPE